MSDPADDIAALLQRLKGGPSPSPAAETPRRIPKPLYLLSVDDPDDRAIVLIIRTSNDGVVRGMIALPQWYELPEMWDGPHDVADAVRLADDYADAYGYHAIAIDIESSQLWDPAWGDLQR
jgi:hypothetical protein